MRKAAILIRHTAERANVRRWLMENGKMGQNVVKMENAEWKT